MQPLISLIVPVYKVERLLRECIDSIVGQTYKNLEIILVDDGSPDKSGRICDDYASVDNRIRVVHQTNKGLSGARNAALDIATGEYIGFVDSDDYIDIDMFEYLWSLISSYKTDIASCGYRKIIDGISYNTINNDDVLVCSSEKAISLLAQDKIIKSMVWLNLYHCSLFSEVRFPQGQVYEDIYTTYKIFTKAKCIAISEASKYNYRIRKESISQIQSEKSLWDRYCAYKKRLDDISECYPKIKNISINQLAFTSIDIYNSLCLLKDSDAEKKKEIISFYKENARVVSLNYKILFRLVKFAENLKLNIAIKSLFSLLNKAKLKKDKTYNDDC